MDSSYLEYLKVYHTDNKIHLGEKRDGGYVIADIGSYDCYISAGIGDDESFSRDFIEKYPNVGSYFAFDNTIEKLPDNFPEKMVRILKNIVPISNDDFNHSSLLQEMNTYENIFLKMDIEGCEYSWLLSLSPSLLVKFKQMVFEFHGVHNDDWGTELKRKIECFKNISNTHYLVHVHANNGGSSVNINGNIMPTVIEVTYVRKDILGNNVELNKDPLPIVGLDYPTQTYLPEMDLSFYPFVNK